MTDRVRVSLTLDRELYAAMIAYGKHEDRTVQNLFVHAAVQLMRRYPRKAKGDEDVKVPDLPAERALQVQAGSPQRHEEIDQ